MRIDVLTLFPEMFESPLSHSILRRAQESGVVDIVLSNIRDFAEDNYRKVDDKPYGGGCGMIMTCGPVLGCFDNVKKQVSGKWRTIMLSPCGKPFDQETAEEFSKEERHILVAGRYEGIDERIKTALDAEEVSIGDYCISGGELAAMVVIDAVVRLLPGALGDDKSSEDESFSDGLLEYPQYTRPEDFRGMKVPEVLLSGDHGKIAEWRKEQSIERTKKRRPDLWKKFTENREQKTESSK